MILPSFPVLFLSVSLFDRATYHVTY